MKNTASKDPFISFTMYYCRVLCRKGDFFYQDENGSLLHFLKKELQNFALILSNKLINDMYIVRTQVPTQVSTYIFTCAAFNRNAKRHLTNIVLDWAEKNLIFLRWIQLLPYDFWGLHVHSHENVNIEHFTKTFETEQNII